MIGPKQTNRKKKFPWASRWASAGRTQRLLTRVRRSAAAVSPRGYLEQPGIKSLALSIIMLVGGVALVSQPAAAVQQFSLTLHVGESYIIHDLDPGSLAVAHSDNSNSFIAKGGASRDLTIFTFQKGEGTVTATSHGEELVYHITVNGMIDASHPLKTGGAPPALDESSSSAAPPAPYAPASAAKRVTANASAAARPTEPVTKVVEPASDPEYDPPTSRAAGAPPSYVAASASAGDPQQTGSADRDITSQSARASSPIITSQQYASDPHEVSRDGYMINRGFGGRHDLPPDAISIASGTSQVYDFPAPISRVSIANTRVADVQILGNHQIMLVGRQPGFTTLVVWDQLNNYLERQIRTDISGHEQVLLNVTVAELNLRKLEQQGIDISAAFKHLGFSIAGLPGLVATPFSASASSVGPISPPLGGQPFSLLLSQAATYALSGANSSVATNALFQFLETHDLARILARPELLANSGDKARFLSGGEIPIVIAQQLTTSIVFKQYGTSVVFIPTVIGERDIGLQVKSEVSEPDYTQGVQLFGFTVPAFVTRRAQTQVRLKDNQTLIIAGLILNQTRSTLQKVPYLGDVPYMGGLFRHTYWSHEKTELVMSVTPEIVGPIPSTGQPALPIEPRTLTPGMVETRPLTTPDVTRPRFQ